MNSSTLIYLNNFLRSNLVFRQCTRSFHATSSNQLFHESHPRGEYKKDDEESIFSHIKKGWKNLGKECKLWANEVKETFVSDAVLNYYPGTVDRQWQFRSQHDLDRWITSCDADNNEGHSSCQFVLSKSGYGLFTGNLDTRVPKDGRIKRAGYCSIKSLRAMRSFKRDAHLNWAPYTHLVIRMRGDGRTYMINIATAGYYDQLWNDIYHYMLFTKGGPYWQVAKIPFSKFFLSSKGRIQDLQSPIDLESVTSLGFTCGDKINGSFSLEIDFIGLEFNPLHDEETAYEMYKIPKFIAAT